MQPKLLTILRCPRCMNPLHVNAREVTDGDVVTGILGCKACGCAYPIRGSVPRFVASDAYASSFSLQWLLHARTQYDSFNGSKNSEVTFHYKTGLREADLLGKLVLDAGCGSGRFIEVARKHGAEVVGVDLSRSVDAAHGILGHDRLIHLVQASIMSLPFAPSVFDAVYSIGVLHHTREPSKAFESLCRCLKAGGRISIWVYSDEGFAKKLVNRVGSIYRAAARLPSRELLYRICSILHGALPIPRILLEGRNFEPQRTARHDYRHPRQFFYIAFPGWSFASSLEWRVLDTFDYLAARYQSKHTYGQVVSWFRKAGLRHFVFPAAEVSVSGLK